MIVSRSKYNGQLQLPWLKTTSSDRCDVTIERADSGKEELYKFFTWSAGDILLNLEGVPPVLEFTK